MNGWQWLDKGPNFVLPTGLILSAIVTLLLLYNGWRGWEMVYRAMSACRTMPRAESENWIDASRDSGHGRRMTAKRCAIHQQQRCLLLAAFVRACGADG